MLFPRYSQFRAPSRTPPSLARIRRREGSRARATPPARWWEHVECLHTSEFLCSNFALAITEGAGTPFQAATHDRHQPATRHADPHSPKVIPLTRLLRTFDSTRLEDFPLLIFLFETFPVILRLPSRHTARSVVSFTSSPHTSWAFPTSTSAARTLRPRTVP